MLDDKPDATADHTAAEEALDLEWPPAEIATPVADLHLFGL